MATYRAYQVGYSGHVATPAKIIEAKSDLQAIVKAMQFVNSKAIEMWDGNAPGSA